MWSPSWQTQNLSAQHEHVEADSTIAQVKIVCLHYRRTISGMNGDFEMKFSRRVNKTPNFHLLGTEFDLLGQILRKSTPKLGAKYAGTAPSSKIAWRNDPLTTRLGLTESSARPLRILHEKFQGKQLYKALWPIRRWPLRKTGTRHFSW